MRSGPKAANSATFKNWRKYKVFTQYFNKNWFSDFAFMVNLFKHMNELTTKLMGKGILVSEMYCVVKA